MSEKPTNITASHSAKELTLTWNDGHVSVYSFSLLRAACPCASCRGGHDSMGSEPNPEVFNTPFTDTPATRLKDILATGTYGITIVWEDGHDYGIYNWHYLRALCPCEECRSQ
ncbi:MAG: hypothetical protein B6243_10070 [Anaerolineaceae bacterium 4572_5.2]|nr:MAG: hypothetical protein B6243_10070 [Anaerolineaceae bacterium 4572_5.2]